MVTLTGFADESAPDLARDKIIPPALENIKDATLS
jgi:hypothetical protein